MLDVTKLDPRQAHRAAPNLANLMGALRELEVTGDVYYAEVAPEGPVLRMEAVTVRAEVDRLLEGSPAVRRFLALMLLAREERLQRGRGGRARRRRR